MPKKKRDNTRQTEKGCGCRTKTAAPVADGELQCYGKVTKEFGRRQFEVVTMTDQDTIRAIARKARNMSGFAKTGDTVLLSLWEFDRSHAHIIHRYEREELRELCRSGEIVDETIQEAPDELIFLDLDE